jgi:inosine-uridine nucleoside N-ribohydrolase
VLDHLFLHSRPEVIPGSSIPLASRHALRNAGVERILSESRGFSPDHRLTVLVIGAATDTASALLADPGLAGRVEIIAMAFDGWEHGGDSFNVFNDPIAWRVILDSGAPVTIGPGPVSLRDLIMASERAHGFFDKTGGSGRYLAGLLDDWLAKHRDIVMQVSGDARRWPVWDEVTVAYMLGFTKSEQHPRPKMKPDLSFDFGAVNGTVTWVTSIDGSRLWADLAGRLERAQPTSRNP